MNIDDYKDKVKDRNASPKSFLITTLCVFLLPLFGGHNFYAGRKGRGIIQFLSVFLLVIPHILWILYDLKTLFYFQFKDGEGREIKPKDETERADRAYSYRCCVF